MAAMVSLAGIDPMRFLLTEDPLEADTMVAIAERHLELEELQGENQAIRIANAVSKALGL